MELNWKVALGLALVGYIIFLAYEAAQAESAVNGAAGGIFGEASQIWSGLTDSLGSITDAANDVSDFYG